MTARLSSFLVLIVFWTSEIFADRVSRTICLILFVLGLMRLEAGEFPESCVARFAFLSQSRNPEELRSVYHALLSEFETEDLKLIQSEVNLTPHMQIQSDRYVYWSAFFDLQMNTAIERSELHQIINSILVSRDPSENSKQRSVLEVSDIDAAAKQIASFPRTNASRTMVCGSIAFSPDGQSLCLTPALIDEGLKAQILKLPAFEEVWSENIPEIAEMFPSYPTALSQHFVAYRRGEKHIEIVNLKTNERNSLELTDGTRHGRPILIRIDEEKDSVEVLTSFTSFKDSSQGTEFFVLKKRIGISGVQIRPFRRYDKLGSNYSADFDSQSKRLEIFSNSTNLRIHSTPYNQPATAFNFSNDGRFLIPRMRELEETTKTEKWTIEVFDLERGVVVRRFPIKFPGYLSAITSGARRMITYNVSDNKSFVAVINLENGDVINRIPFGSSSLNKAKEIILSPDEKHALVGFSDSPPAVLDVETGRKIFEVPVRADLDGAAFSSDGSFLVTIHQGIHGAWMWKLGLADQWEGGNAP